MEFVRMWSLFFAMMIESCFCRFVNFESLEDQSMMMLEIDPCLAPVFM